MKDQEVAMVIHINVSENSYLNSQIIKKAKIAIMSTYLNHIQKEEKWQEDQVEILQTALIQAKKDYNKEFNKLRKETKKIEKDSGVRKRIYDEARPGIMHKHYDPVIKSYEKKAYYGTVSLGLLLNEISRALRDINITMGSIVERTKTTVLIGNKMGLGSLKVATYFKSEGRFVLIHHGQNGRPNIYKLRSKQELHFVQDKYDQFIPRYVIRNLSKFDLPHLNKPLNMLSVGMGSRNGMVLPNKNFRKAIFSHLRSAQQGNSFFVSTTYLERPIFGATGKNFYDPKNGQVKIDLAEIPKNRIVDVCSKKALNRFMKVSKLNWNLKFSEEDNYQNMAAARDTVRTGEILIHGRIPREAVVAFRTGKKGKWESPFYTNLKYV